MIKNLLNSLNIYENNNAFCINNLFYTYKQFGSRIKAIAQAIFGKSNTKRIGIITNNDLETYSSILACWLCGYAYIPINPKIPKERNYFIIQEAAIDLLLCSDLSKDYIANFNVNIIYSGEVELTDSNSDFEYAKLQDDDLLYILFTSGSTGIPKGVPINYKNVVTFIDSYNALQFDCTERDRFLQMFDLTFDVSVASYLIPLFIGACVYTVPIDGIKYTNVYSILTNHKITFASIVPSIINYLQPYFSEIKLPELKYCILTAEASNVEIVSKWAYTLPDCTIMNLYGPTEATIWCTGYKFLKHNPKSYNEMLAIGRCFNNVEAIILDENNNEVRDGEKGHFCIASDQLTYGYLNEEQNEKAFFVKNKRFYKTGDLCYKDHDGDIFYCGRMDHQIKIQGFRIELSEIEAITRELSNVNTVCVPYKNHLGIDQICLFLEKYQGKIDAIKDGITNKLPYYMIPSMILSINDFPYNNSGKIDRLALRSTLLVSE